jgi:predicted DNA-binding protein
MKENKEKIEFWLHSNYKNALKEISERTGYSVSELMRRSVEQIIRELHPNYFSQININGAVNQPKEENNV